jgi:membrane-associated phospholipid phosphatase
VRCPREARGRLRPFLWAGSPRRAWFVLFASSLVFAALAAAVLAGAAIPGDRAAYRLLNRDRGAYLIGGVAEVLASRTIEVVAAVALVLTSLLLLVKGRVRAAALLVASLVPVLITPALKGALDRPPPEAHASTVDWSFPSGHAAGSMALVAVAIILTRSSGSGRWRVFAGAVAVAAVGLAAVIAGGHWPSDVLAGWALALAWVSALCLLVRVDGESV